MGGGSGMLLQIFVGQLVSFNLAILSFTVSLITNQGVDAPLSVSFFSYLSLAVVYGTILLWRRQKLQLSWYWYVPLAFVDVQGNYLVVKAYEYTSITSVTLLDCCTIVWAIVLTWLFLGTRYGVWQFFGVGISLLGLSLLLLSDYDPTALDGSKPLFGDILVIGGTIFLSMSNVGMEFCVKEKDRVEVLAMMGFFGMLISALGMATAERKSLESITLSPQLVAMSSSRWWWWWRENEGIGRKLLELGLGQLVSFDLAIMTFSASLVSIQVDAPLSLTFTTYTAVALVYGSIMLYRRQKLLVPWYWYALLGFVDVHGNYLVNKAFQFTSITSVTILDCWTVAWSIILTWIFLGTKYSPFQFVGAAVCVGGLALVLVSDAGVGGGGGSNPLLGDFLVIVGSLFFTMSNVGEEFCVKRKDRIEVVTMIGVFGMLISAAEISLVERNALASIQWSTGLFSAYAVYAVSSFLFCTLTPFVLKTSGAAFFNLSMLTSDMWAVVIRIFIYKQKVDWLYYLAFFIVVVGIVIYTKSEKDPDNARVLENGNPNPDAAEYSLIDEKIIEDDLLIN